MLPFKRNNRGVEVPGASQGGFVLIIVLLVTAVLVAVVAEFAYNMYLSTARAANFKDGQRAGLLADRGAELAGAAIEELLKATPNLTIEKDGLIFFKTEGDMTVTLRIVDELGKLSLRTVYQNNGVKNAATYDEYSRLLNNLGVPERSRLEGPLADWIDADDEPRSYGAEAADYYLNLPKPYRPSNRYLESTDELLMIKDYTPEVFARVSPFVSPYNTDGLVNINTAPAEVLMALSDDMTDSLVRKIMDHRREAPFKDKSDIMKVPGFEKTGFDLMGKITVKSDTFRIYSKAASGEITREAEAVYKLKTGFVYWREM